MPTRKNRAGFTYFLLAALVVSIVTGVFIVVVFLHKREQGESIMEIELSTEGVTQETLEIDGLTLAPGKDVEYTLSLLDGVGEYTFGFSVEQTAFSNMQAFVNVSFFIDGECKAEIGLDKLYAGDTVSFVHTLLLDSPTDIVVRYEMPSTVGDEAQGTSATFCLVLTAQAA